MKRKQAGRWTILPVAILAVASVASAQDRDRRIDPREIIRSADDNNDGVIEQSELGQRSGYYVRQAAQRAGLDPDGRLPADKIFAALEAMAKEQGSGQSGSSSGSGSSSYGGSSKPATPPGAPQGFGAPAVPSATAAAAKIPGFDVPLTAGSTAGLDKKYDPRVLEYVNEMLKERDVNKNGILEKVEWTGRWSTPAEESDTNHDGVLDKEELCIRIAKRFGITGTGGSSSGGSGSGAPSPGPPGSSGGPPGGSSGGSGDASRTRGYAESLISRYDDNKNGMLERDESKDMRSEHQSSDANKDGVITIDELMAHLQSYGGGSSGSPGGGSSGPPGPFGGPPRGDSGTSSGGSSSSGTSSSGSSRFGERGGFFGSRSEKDKSKEPAKKSYRFTTPTERLPKGMPDWFLRGDADADGQVSMVEYTTSWTEAAAAEFMKYDLDGDGMITPEEVLQVTPPKR